MYFEESGGEILKPFEKLIPKWKIYDIIKILFKERKIMIYIIVGNSGSGKTTQANALTHLGIRKIITYTTRAPREGEVDGKDYHFIKLENFLEMDAQGKFIGTTCYLKNYYSTLREDLESCYHEGKDCVIVVDEEGVRAIRREYPNSICIYLYTDPQVLRGRMEKRGDPDSVIEKRMANLGQFEGLYDYLVDSSGDSDYVYQQIVSIVLKTGGLRK